MKNITITTTREDVKKAVSYFRLWAILFILIIVLNVFLGTPATSVLLILGLFLSLIGWYSNTKLLRTKGNVLSKTVMDINTVKTSLMYEKIVSVFILLFIGFIIFISAIADYQTIIGYLTFFVFVLFNFYIRKKRLSKFIKK